SEGTVILQMEASDADDTNQAATADTQEDASNASPGTSPKDSESAAQETQPAPSSSSDVPAESATSAVVQAGASDSLASTPRERHSPTVAFGTSDLPPGNLPHASPSVR